MRWGLGDFWIATGIFLLVGVVLGAIAVFDDLSALATDSQREIDIGTAWLPFLIATPALLQVCYVLWAVRRKGRGPAADIAVRFRSVDLGIGAVLFVVGLTAATVLAVTMEHLFGISPSAAVADLVEDSDDTAGGISGWIVLLAVLVALVIPVIEEIVYRGLLWSALEKRGMGETAVLVLSSLIFAAIHLEPARFPILFVLGIALGYGRIRTGRLGPCVTAHICLNSVGMIALLATL
ncbi:MAG: CPBP family intramembrane metalloprotease [Acidimicrobiaceae bacterium]|nr:CPBP family intramembrane metalloprotease [Acidimicrobiaceae bacterium]MYG55322.1 CPBP family intramembrane metalloprotease [Acidimicrobiaceae bacterium]MYJ99601.1 CPBP family intramembrane metalloprotease [Acidimicrobiaceae bacterium]